MHETSLRQPPPAPCQPVPSTISRQNGVPRRTKNEFQRWLSSSGVRWDLSMVDSVMDGFFYAEDGRRPAITSADISAIATWLQRRGRRVHIQKKQNKLQGPLE